jgi:hypothetical protein
VEVHIWTGEELGTQSPAGDRMRARLGNEANRRLAFALAPRATAGALLLAAVSSVAPLAASIATPAAAVAATPGEAEDPNTTAEDAGDGGDDPGTLPPDVRAGLYDDDAPPPDDVHDDATTPPDPSAPDEGGQPETPGESPQTPPAAPPATPEPQPASPQPEQQPGAPEPTPAATSQPPAPQPQPAPPIAQTPDAQPTAPQTTVAAPRPRSATPHRLFLGQRHSALSSARAPRRSAQSARATPRPTTRVAFALPARRTTSLDRIGGRSYRVHIGDSLWAIAQRTLGPRASAADIARTVHALWRLNADRIASGSPDLIAVGTDLRLPN